MKRITIIVVIAILLLACFAGIGLILLLLVFPFAYYTIKFKEKREPPKVMYATVEDVESKYGEPDDVVVLDASRANELPCLVLFYSAQDVMIAAGEELRISDMTSVMPKNMATPYTIDEWAVIINTKNPQHPNIHLRVGYDAGLAREIAEQIYAHKS
ncbi:MAG: hypothetical protein J6Z10_05705 [Prevotella sp.]|nr:hypothetical protein [Prevotella sp.]